MDKLARVLKRKIEAILDAVDEALPRVGSRPRSEPIPVPIRNEPGF